jgi:hypothetical protein
MTLWFTQDGEYAVCDGPGPTNVAGYIIELPKGGGWIIKGDRLNRRFLDHQSAAASVLNRPLPKDLLSYLVKRGGEERTVLTYPDVIEHIRADGWTVVMSEKPKQK